MNMDAPKLKRSPYLSSMVSGGNGGGWRSLSSSTDGDDGVSDSASNSSARYHPAATAAATSTSSNNNIKPQQAAPPRRKLRHALNEGSSYSRDYFNLRRPKGTQHNNRRSLPRNNNGGGAAELTSTSTGAQSALSIHSMFSPYINPDNNSSTASFSSTTTSTASIVSASAAASGHGGVKMKIQRRRRTSTSKHPTPQQLSQLSSSAPLSSSPPKLQYYYPNPFSTTNLRDMIRLHQESNTTEGETPGGATVTSTSSVEGGCSGSSTQPSPSPQIMSELDDDEEEEMMEDVAPLGNAPLYHMQSGGKNRSPMRLPSAYRSLPQLGGTTHNNQQGSRVQQSSYNFFQQVLLDPIDGVEDDINRFKRNEGWKEIRMYADDTANPNPGGGNVGYLNQLMVDSDGGNGGRITNNDGSMGAGIVSDDNDGSAGEEDTTVNKAVVVQKYWKRKLSVESSTSSYEEDEEDGSSPPRHLPAAGASSSSLRRSRNTNTVGAGLAYGSDTLRSYQSRSSSR